MSRTRRMNADEVEKVLQRYGFVLVSQKGSHRNLPIGTLRNIMTTADIPNSEWKTE